MSNEKGGLIKKKKKPTIMQPSVPVKKNDMDFGYTEPQKQEKPAVVKPTAKPEVTKITPPTHRKKLGVGKTNSTKSLKVPTLIHSELNLLGSFMDEHKTYVILQNLIDSYVKNELTDRQQRQFDFMVEAFFEDK
ncbi:hypothetical protein SporoP37_16690 (plasmid) [Sporosarcina sp. P37]|uniref:hypothetical protein n=1 Tax=unclassified Sporosarcina TaxID=2647733 RepID=UPI000A17E825|nr:MULTISPECIES: hypothetical protein [unclassified Sporosarcina]ARK26410.1 hypothetical protein SporoP37_16690 [Sporosarcina sp. P37]PID17637.1 hypothetical protein CSV62_12640 [Sporosarcina sp. P35]